MLSTTIYKFLLVMLNGKTSSYVAAQSGADQEILEKVVPEPAILEKIASKRHPCFKRRFYKFFFCCQ